MNVLTLIFDVMIYAVTWMRTHYVPIINITWYALYSGALVTTGLYDALKTFLPNQGEKK